MKTIEEGSVVTLNYKGTFDDGTEFDSSYSRGEPITCTIGEGGLIEGFESALPGMETGDTKTVHLSPDQAYGDYKDGAIMPVPSEMFAENFIPEVGGTVYGKNDMGQEMIAKIVSFDDSEVTLDFNHPMAGKNLNFEIKIEDIK